ncbi:MAG: hypothetical protein GVX96_05620 [Bacteroidetes bacterium]|jgi:hypothetical protein|nr:hypothetical protein [Bacteroidota bacterium]
MADKNDEIREFLESMSDSFEIMEERVDIQTQKDYLDYSHSFDRGKLTDKQTFQLGDTLFSQETTPADKKKILVLLAHLGTIIAYRQIEKYYKKPDIELKPWATLALQECRMFLENDLTDQNKGLILSGLGAVKDKFRYYFLLLPCTDKPFTSTQNGIIKKEIHHVAKNLNCILETIDFSAHYAALTALVPADVAIGTFIESGIKKCNERGVVVYEHYYATNGHIPDEPEIWDIIRKVKG